MVTKPDYLQFLELQEGVFSVMKFHTFDKEILKYLDEKNFKRVFEESTVSKTGKASWYEVIFETNQQFYIHLKLSERVEEESYWMHIYYKPEKRNELLFFTTQILKPFREKTNDQ